MLTDVGENARQLETKRTRPKMVGFWNYTGPFVID